MYYVYIRLQLLHVYKFVRRLIPYYFIIFILRRLHDYGQAITHAFYIRHSVIYSPCFQDFPSQFIYFFTKKNTYLNFQRSAHKSRRTWPLLALQCLKVTMSCIKKRYVDMSKHFITLFQDNYLISLFGNKVMLRNMSSTESFEVVNNTIVRYPFK